MTILSNSLQAMLTRLPDAQHAVVSDRFLQQAPALLERLQRLYGKTENFASWFTSLMASVATVAAERPYELQQLDQQRLKDTAWFSSQDMLGYCAYLDKFAGDLNGVIDKIAHLNEMGVRYLHLLPFLRARSGENDGGFAVSSFNEIEPSFGSMAELRTLAAHLRQSKISLCSDFILNHVADDHPWALAAKAGDTRYRNYFYTYPDRHIPDKYEQSLGQIFPQAAPGNFSYVEALQRWVWTSFYPYQWDLNYTNPAVFSEMALALLHLANQGIEVFRLDSTAFLWKREGSNCMNQAETHWILQALRGIVEIVAPGVLLKAEAIVPTAQLPAYLGTETEAATDPEAASSEDHLALKECHIAYHSSLMAAAWAALAEQNTSMLESVMRGTPALPVQTSWLTYVRCHDDIGWNVLRQEAGAHAQQRLAQVSQFFSGERGSYARGASFQAAAPEAVHGSVGMSSALCGVSSAASDAQWKMAQDRMLLLYGLAFTFGGLPVIYMGDELAQGNDESYRKDVAKLDDSRWLQRPDFDLQAYAARHQADSQSGQLFAALCKMLASRRASPQLAATQARHLLSSQHSQLLIFARGDLSGNQTLYFIGNFSEHAVTLDLRVLNTETSPAQPWFDVLSNEVYQPKSMHFAVIPAYSQLWLRRATQGKPS